MFGILNSFFQILLIPLSFLPVSVLSFFGFITSFFALFIVGKLLRWLWDILPIA